MTFRELRVFGDVTSKAIVDFIVSLPQPDNRTVGVLQLIFQVCSHEGEVFGAVSAGEEVGNVVPHGEEDIVEIRPSRRSLMIDILLHSEYMEHEPQRAGIA